MVEEEAEKENKTILLVQQCGNVAAGALKSSRVREKEGERAESKGKAPEHC